MIDGQLRIAVGLVKPLRTDARWLMDVVCWKVVNSVGNCILGLTRLCMITGLSPRCTIIRLSVVHKPRSVSISSSPSPRMVVLDKAQDAELLSSVDALTSGQMVLTDFLLQNAGGGYYMFRMKEL